MRNLTTPTDVRLRRVNAVFRELLMASTSGVPESLTAPDVPIATARYPSEGYKRRNSFARRRRIRKLFCRGPAGKQLESVLGRCPGRQLHSLVGELEVTYHRMMQVFHAGAV